MIDSWSRRLCNVDFSKDYLCLLLVLFVHAEPTPLPSYLMALGSQETKLTFLVNGCIIRIIIYIFVARIVYMRLLVFEAKAHVKHL